MPSFQEAPKEGRWRLQSGLSVSELSLIVIYFWSAQCSSLLQFHRKDCHG